MAGFKGECDLLLPYLDSLGEGTVTFLSSDFRFVVFQCRFVNQQRGTLARLDQGPTRLRIARIAEKSDASRARTWVDLHDLPACLVLQDQTKGSTPMFNQRSSHGSETKCLRKLLESTIVPCNAVQSVRLTYQSGLYSRVLSRGEDVSRGPSCGG